MNANSTKMQGYALAAYIILAPLISNAIALFLPLPVVTIVLLLLLIPPALAILLTALAEGRRSVAELLKKLIQWRIGLQWYAVALGMPIGIILVCGVLAFLFGWSSAFQIRIPESSQLIINGVLIVFIAIFEEFGWRGYALPRLLTRRSPLTSALIIGTAWGGLHIGLGLSAGRPWLPSFLMPCAASVAFTWLFVHTRGSLPMAILYHFALDSTPQFLFGLTDIQKVWILAIVNLGLALVLTLVYGSNLKRGPAKEPAVAGAS